MLLLGAGFIGSSFIDYSDRTERADAVVSDRSRQYDQKCDCRETVLYVDYTADGHGYEGVKLEDGGAGNREGDTVTVAYPPGEPMKVVTADMTEEGPYDFMLYPGAATLAASGAFFTTAVVKARRKHRGG